MPPRGVTPLPAGPGQESVWDYPRPPRLERVARAVRIVFNDITIADTNRALRVLETSHPPVYYLPPEDIRMEHLVPRSHTSFCEWKGRAVYYDVRVGTEAAEASAWAYPAPVPRFEALRDHVAFYAHEMDACYVGDERARAQPGGFYGGWVTDDVVGPFKGAPGSWGW